MTVATLEEALVVIDALNARTAANDVTMAEQQSRIAELEHQLADVPQLGEQLTAAQAEIQRLSAELTQSNTMRAALMQGIQGFASGLPDGQQLLLRVLIDQTPGAADKLRELERIQLEGSIAAQQARLAALSTN